jgi:hypothetical protein
LNIDYAAAQAVAAALRRKEWAIPARRADEGRDFRASVFQGRRKSNNIHASSGVIWGIPAEILPQIPLGRLGEPEEIAGLIILPVL